MTNKKLDLAISTRKPEIDYPCIWQYKVIGKERHLVVTAIEEVCALHAVTITPSHSSANGKYHCFNAELEVQDEASRIAIYQALFHHPAIQTVI